MAYKVFSNGDALTGGELNTYLMNQSVIQFASTTARDAAIPSPAEGQLVWLQDSNKYVYYTGSAWSDLLTPASSGNAIINGAFDIWQRGTSFTNPSDGSYTVDRWRKYGDGSGRTVTFSQQTFTPGTAPVSGYEGTFFARIAQSVAGSGASYNSFTQRIENVRTFAGQTVSVSFWAKAGDSQTLPNVYLRQNFGTGGSTQVDTTVASSVALTTSWQRFTYSVALPSIAGKTVSANDSYLNLEFSLPLNNTHTIDFWGVQLESGSSATTFKRNASNIQGELAACQRYYWRITGNSYTRTPYGVATTSSNVLLPLVNPVPLRVMATALEYTGSNKWTVNDMVNTITFSSATIEGGTSTTYVTWLQIPVSGATQFRNYLLQASNDANAFVGISAEL